MGGYSGTIDGGYLSQIMGRLGQQGGQGAEQAPQGLPNGQQGYPGLQMPAFSYHNLPQFSFGAQPGLPSGGAYQGILSSLPGWNMQQQGQTPQASAGNWKPTVTSQNQNQGGGQKNYDNPYVQLANQGYAYIPGQGMVTMDPLFFGGYGVGLE